MSAATDRLEVTRARLRLAMSPPVVAPSDAERGTPVWLRSLLQLPVVGTVFEALDAWWAHHPLRPVAKVAGEASHAAVRPFADKNPLTLVAVAAAAGAVLVWARPWRWLLRSALFAGLVPQLASRLVSRLPIESWMTMLGAAVRPPTTGSRSEPPARQVVRPQSASTSVTREAVEPASV